MEDQRALIFFSRAVFFSAWRVERCTAISIPWKVFKIQKIVIKDRWILENNCKIDFENEITNIRTCVTKLSFNFQFGAVRTLDLCFESSQSILELSEQRTQCTSFSLLSQASLHCYGLLVSCPGPCVSSGWRLSAALFLVFRLDSKGPKVGIQLENNVGEKPGTDPHNEKEWTREARKQKFAEAEG